MRYHVLEFRSGKRVMKYTILAEDEADAKLRFYMALSGLHEAIDDVQVIKVYEEVEKYEEEIDGKTETA